MRKPTGKGDESPQPKPQPDYDDMDESGAPLIGTISTWVEVPKVDRRKPSGPIGFRPPMAPEEKR